MQLNCIGLIKHLHARNNIYPNPYPNVINLMIKCYLLKDLTERAKVSTGLGTWVAW